MWLVINIIIFWQTNLSLPKIHFISQNYLTPFRSKCSDSQRDAPRFQMHYIIHSIHLQKFQHTGSCNDGKRFFNHFYSNFIVHCSLFSFVHYFSSDHPANSLLFFRHSLARLIVIIITPQLSFVYICRKDEWRVTQKMTFFFIFVLFLFCYVAIRIPVGIYVSTS